MGQLSEKKPKAARAHWQRQVREPSKTGGETKKEKCLKLLARRQGASIEELQEAVGWQAHRVRGFLSSTVRRLAGYQLEAFAADDEPRHYKVTNTASHS